MHPFQTTLTVKLDGPSELLVHAAIEQIKAGIMQSPYPNNIRVVSVDDSGAKSMLREEGKNAPDPAP